MLEPFLADPDSLVVLSTDLSHYPPYAQACERDAATAHRDRRSRLAGDCRRGCLRCVSAAGSAGRGRAVDLPVELLDLRNSGDTGPHDRVVGYGAFTVGL